MKNNFKTIAISLLATIFLASCNVAPSSQSTSNDTTNTTSTTNTAAVVSSINLTTEGSLIQFAGLTSRVLVTAVVNGNNVNNIQLEWYVNNVKSLTQTGLQFEYLPVALGTFIINAKFKDVVSNNISVGVDQPSFTASLINATSASVLEVTAISGLTFSISGNTILSSSNYNIANSKYILNLSSPMIQGTTYTITMNRAGFNPFVTTYLYDTRTLKVGSLTYNSKRITPNNEGVYSLIRPFDNSTLSYTLSLDQTNLEGVTAVSILTDAPAGVTIAPYQQTLTLLKGTTIDRTYTLTRTSPLGVYTHNVNVGGRLLSVRVFLVEPSPTIAFEDDAPFVYGAAGTLDANTGVYASNASIFAKTDGVITNAVKPEADGSYVVFKPYNGPAKQIAFKLRADYFAVPTGFPEQGNPHVLLAVLSGPSGGTMLYGASIANTLASSTQFRSTLTDLLVFSNIDSKTTVGTYTYTFTAGTFSSSNVNRTIRVVVKEFVPKMETVITYGGNPLAANSDGSFTLVKPLAGNNVTNTISLKVSYFESPFQFQAGTGLDTLYDPDTANANDVPRFLLNYTVAYSGPFSGIAPVNSKIAIELGAQADATNTVNPLGTATPDYNRYIGTGDNTTINITANIANMGTLNPTTFPGTHTYTVTIGSLTRAIVLKVEEPSPKINLGANSIRYGGQSDSGSTLASNVTFNESENKYYVSGPNKFLSISVQPFGMPNGSGAYPYTFTRTTPSGSFLSNTNTVNLVLNTSPYNGTLEFPASPAVGSEMVIGEILTEEGEYKFTYNINGATRSISLIVLPDPQLRLEQLTYNDEALTFFNGEYYIERATSNRFLSAVVSPVNSKSTYKYTLSTIASDATDATDSTKSDLVLAEGKLLLELTLTGSANINSKVIDQVIYYLRLYDGSSLVGVVAQIVVNVQDKD
jgi:hypothetical protein